MSLTRRDALAGASGVGLGLGLAAGASAAPRPGAGTLAAYLDTLIPADEQGPGALGLGVLDSFEVAAQDPGYRRLLDLGCAWLDQQAAFLGDTRFAALGETERARLVLVASEQAPGTVARVFFETTREHAFSVFWARPEAWAGIGYQGPPQPEGFPDYALPPDET